MVRGRKADDTVDLGDGDDVFLHQAIDGSDRVDGGAGQDMGSTGGTDNDDIIEVGSSGARTRVFGASSGSLELDRTEQIVVDPKAGTDNVIVHDLAGTPTSEVDRRFFAPDQRVDTLTVLGSTGPETIKATSSGPVAHRERARGDGAARPAPSRGRSWRSTPATGTTRSMPRASPRTSSSRS